MPSAPTGCRKVTRSHPACRVGLTGIGVCNSLLGPDDLHPSERQLDRVEVVVHPDSNTESGRRSQLIHRLRGALDRCAALRLSPWTEDEVEEVEAALKPDLVP